MENPNVYADAGDMGLPRRSVSRGSARSMGSRASARSAALYGNRPPSVAGSVRSRGSRRSRDVGSAVRPSRAYPRVAR